MNFPTPAQIIALHDTILARTGGSPGLRDEGGLEGAIGAVMQGHAYGGGTVPAIAARMAGRVAKAHAFVDGNKRACVAIYHLTLALNGWRTTTAPEDIARAAIAAAQEGEAPFLHFVPACAPDPAYQLLMDYDRGTWTPQA